MPHLQAVSGASVAAATTTIAAGTASQANCRSCNTCAAHGLEVGHAFLGVHPSGKQASVSIQFTHSTATTAAPDGAGSDGYPQAGEPYCGVVAHELCRAKGGCTRTCQ